MLPRRASSTSRSCFRRHSHLVLSGGQGEHGFKVTLLSTLVDWLNIPFQSTIVIWLAGGVFENQFVVMSTSQSRLFLCVMLVIEWKTVQKSVFEWFLGRQHCRTIVERSMPFNWTGLPIHCSDQSATHALRTFAKVSHFVRQKRAFQYYISATHAHACQCVPGSKYCKEQRHTHITRHPRDD